MTIDSCGCIILGMTRSSYPKRSIRSRIIPAILRRLGWIGLHFEPYLIVREGFDNSVAASADQKFRFGFLPLEEIESLADFGPNGGVEKMRRWMTEDGKRCFAAWDGQRLAAKMWCDFKEYNHKPNFRFLDEDEVYLFAAYSHPDYRGQNLAPKTRLHCYEGLKALGRTKFYSVTEYYNSAARRFKEKLGARNESLVLYVSLFNRWSRTFTLNTYK